jgi:hypothetical protein
MVKEVELDTGFVVTVKVALVLPLSTVTLAGTPATEVLLLDNDTSAPPLGAGPLSVTVPVEVLLPITLVGLSWSEPTCRTVRVCTSTSEALVPTLTFTPLLVVR